MLLQELYDLKDEDGKRILDCPKFLLTNTLFLVKMGSQAYGVSNDDSDYDVYGCAMPRIGQIFPHLDGCIPGFGEQTTPFNNYQQHHIKSPIDNIEYDFNIYGIVSYFNLCMDCNPNMIDSLFVPDNCIIHITKIGQMIRENRKMFLCKKAWHTYKGYGHSQLHKAQGKNPKKGSKRYELREQYGVDTKYLYNVYRNLSQVEQILMEEDLDLQETGRREVMKEIRRGEWSFDRVQEWFNNKEKQLEQAYHDSKLPNTPREKEIRELLMNCLEEHYGKLDNAISSALVVPDRYQKTLMEVKGLIEKSGL